MKDSGTKVLSLNNGGYLILANVENPGRGSDICLIRTDKFGNTVGPPKLYGYERIDRGYTIKKNDQGYIIAGSSQDEENMFFNAYIIQINDNGDTVWTKKYGKVNGNDEVYDVFVHDDGRIILTGYTDSINVKKDILFLELDSDGKKIGSAGQLGDAEDDVAYAVLPYGNTYVFAGYAHKRVLSLEYVKWAYLVIWRGIGPNQGYTLKADAEAIAIINKEPDEYLIACKTDSEDGSLITLADVKADGTILWAKDFGQRSVNVPSDINIREGFVHITGTSTNTESTGDILLLTTRLDGEGPVYSYIGDGTSFAAGGFDYTGDGGFIITGSNFIGTNSIITLCKLDADGVLR